MKLTADFCENVINVVPRTPDMCTRNYSIAFPNEMKFNLIDSI
ncbi:mCG1048601 [Mus musculus]|nr:mCG1048601 [Mus musculus]